MSKFGREKIALLLACASVLGGKASATQNVKTGQTLATVRRGEPLSKKGMPLAAKVVAGTFGTLGSLEVIHSIIGATTNSKLGRYSIGRAIKNSLVDKKALIGKISAVMNEFLTICEIKCLPEYRNALKEKIKDSYINMPFVPELFDQCAKNKGIDLDKLLSRVKIDAAKDELQEGEPDNDYKARLLSENVLPEIKEFLDGLNNGDLLKKVEEEAKEVEEKVGIEIKYTADSIVIFYGGIKFSFTMNSNGSLTCEQLDNKDVDFRITFTQPE